MLNNFRRERMAIYVKSVRDFFAKYFKREEIEEDKASKFETYLSIIYKLLIWEDPFLSGIALSVAHVLFWIVIYFELRIYGIVFISLMVLFVFDATFDSIIIQTDRSVPLKNIRETIKICTAFLHYLTSLRREHPGTFCVCMCTGFLVLSIIGRALSGLFLTYLGLISLLLIPGIIYRLPPEVLETVRHTLHVISTDDGVMDELELFPNVQEDGLLEEKDGDCDSLKTDHTADSCTNSFISGVTSMPSYLDAEGSLDGLDEDDLELTRNLPIVSQSNYSSDTSDSEHKDIKFESSHFNRDSSSDEEQHYEQGLAFAAVDVEGESLKAARGGLLGMELLSNLGSMGTSLVSSVLKTAATAPTITKRSDSESDFEIIDTEDLQAEET